MLHPWLPRVFRWLLWERPYRSLQTEQLVAARTFWCGVTAQASENILACRAFPVAVTDRCIGHAVGAPEASSVTNPAWLDTVLSMRGELIVEDGFGSAFDKRREQYQKSLW